MGFPTFGVDKPGGTTGEQDKSCNPGFQHRGKKASKQLAIKPVGVAAVGETSNLTEESFGSTHRVLKHTQTCPLGNQHLKGHDLLVRSEGSDRK